MKNDGYYTVAKAIRVEKNETTGDYFIVFKVTDEQFKKHIKENWLDDIELTVIGKNLMRQT